MRTSTRRHQLGVTLIEVVIAVTIMASSIVGTTKALMTLNRNAAVARVKNLAKALVLSRIQEVASTLYDPSGLPTPFVATNLTVGTTSETVNLGDTGLGIGSLPATLTWTVAEVGSLKMRSVKCKITYTYLGRNATYELVTYRTVD